MYTVFSLSHHKGTLSTESTEGSRTYVHVYTCCQHAASPIYATKWPTKNHKLLLWVLLIEKLYNPCLLKPPAVRVLMFVQCMAYRDIFGILHVKLADRVKGCEIYGAAQSYKFTDPGLHTDTRSLHAAQTTGYFRLKNTNVISCVLQFCWMCIYHHQDCRHLTLNSMFIQHSHMLVQIHSISEPGLLNVSRLCHLFLGGMGEFFRWVCFCLLTYISHPCPSQRVIYVVKHVFPQALVENSACKLCRCKFSPLRKEV